MDDYLTPTCITIEAVAKMDKFELLRRTPEMFDLNEIDRELILCAAQIRADEIGFGKAFELAVKSLRKQSRDIAPVRDVDIELDYDRNGKPLLTVENFHRVLSFEAAFRLLRYNAMTDAAEIDTITEDGLKKRKWGDSDDSRAMQHIEGKYGLYSDVKYRHAMRVYLDEQSYNPVTDMLNALKWDGTPRIEGFLTKWMGCADTPYVQECSRLIFAGGVHRAFKPGCKFDDVVVLIGTKQGEGKSTLVQWLAMRDEFFTEVTEIEGQRGIEILKGAWICELSELLGLTKAKEVEAVKSYITRMVDRYRRPYDRYVTENPRRCVFIGTTNRRQFLTDKTGNRRFYPVETNGSGYDLFDRQEEVKEDIRQCWAEAVQRFRDGKLPSFANRALLPSIREEQDLAAEDDWRIGVIEKYLNGKRVGDSVCVIELWERALGETIKRPERKDSNEISAIMQNQTDWKKMQIPKSMGEWGYQRGWTRREHTIPVQELPFMD